ncbi:MAG: DUF2795 domain-containing protein [Hyphomicrobiaceae bacterium]|nr:DUF2795 domain-containing protein [Hyphomicrobiaceae bacterium]
MARGVGGVSAANDPISAARRNRAPKEIMDTIERLPDEELGGPQEVQRAYGDIT